MLKTVRAKINKKGEVKLLEPLKVIDEKEAILIVSDDEIDLTEPTILEIAALNEKSLAEDWESEADSRWDTKL